MQITSKGKRINQEPVAYEYFCAKCDPKSTNPKQIGVDSERRFLRYFLHSPWIIWELNALGITISKS